MKVFGRGGTASVAGGSAPVAGGEGEADAPGPAAAEFVAEACGGDDWDTGGGAC